MAPSLSVILTSYNYAHLLPTAIESVLSQSYTDYELIIIDDGSTDESPQIIQSYAERYPQIRAYLRKENRGVIATVNEGVDLSRGTYLQTLSADDKHLPDFLYKTMKVLQAHPDVGLCCSNFANFNDENPDLILNQPLLPDVKEMHIYNTEEMLPLFQTTLFWIPGHTSIFKRELILKYGKFDSDLCFKCDYILLHSIALNHGVAYIPEPLAAMRMHSQAYSANKSVKQRRKIYSHIMRKLYRNPKLLDQFRRSSLLAFIFMDRFWFKLIDPRYITFWPYVNLRCPIKERMIHSFKYYYSRFKYHLGLRNAE